MSTLRVRDLMSSDVLTLSSNETIARAAFVLAERGVQGAPVVDGDTVVGVLSNTDLVRAMHLSPEATVSEIMTRDIMTVQPGDTAVTAAKSMLRRRVHRVLVVDADGRLQGVVTTTDALEAFVRGELRAEDFPRDSVHPEPAQAVPSDGRAPQA